MHRFYVSSEGVAGGKAWLSQEDAHHALHVLRLTPGCQVQLIDSGKLYLGEISAADGDDVQAEIISELPSSEAKLRITLFQGLAKGEKMEMIIQKAVEIGADTVVPVAMASSIVHLEGKDAQRKQERWQKIAREAGKQSGRCLMMNVKNVMNIEKACSMMQKMDRVIVPWEEEHNLSLKEFCRKNPEVGSLGIVIGPEGGIDKEEIHLLRDRANAAPVTLGRRILRTETAGICAMSALLCLYGDME